MTADKVKNAAYKMLAAVLATLIGYLSLRYLLPVTLPFIAAYLVSLAVRPISRFIRKQSPRMDKPATALVLVILTALFVWGLYSVAKLLWDQLSGFIGTLTSDLGSAENPIRKAVDFCAGLGERLPILSRLSLSRESASRLADMSDEVLRSVAVKISTAAADLAGRIISALPSSFIAFFVFFSATFCFSLDRGSFADSLAEFIPRDKLSKLRHRRDLILSALGRYARTYFLMMAVVFALLYLGLLIIGIRYAFLIALATAIVDLLPVLGVGTVLVPWGIFCLISGDVSTGIGLLVLFVIITVIRELLEPHIMGTFIGVHPILALAAVYAGMKLFGVPGLILAPVILCLVRAVLVGEEKG